MANLIGIIPNDFIRSEIERIEVERIEADGGKPNGHDTASAEEIEILDLGQDDWIILPRAWLLKNIFCRRMVSSLSAPGAGGKTSLRIAQLMSCAIGRSLTGEHVFQQCCVLIVGFEDDIDEMRRRVRACMLHYDISNEDIAGWLFIACLGTKPWKLAGYDAGGNIVVGELRDKLIRLIVENNLDIVSLDPFVKTHGVDENDNKAIGFVATILAGISHQYNCAIDAPHHTNKATSNGNTEDANRGRGASSFKDAARLVYGLRHMSEDEAKQFGVPLQERRLLIRMDSAKVNIAPPSAEATWFKLVGVRLGNGNELYPYGDEVATVEPWEPPDTWAGLSNAVLNEALSEIDAGMPDGQRYSGAASAKARAAWKVVQKHCSDKTEAQCREIVKTWIKNGVLEEVEYYDEKERKTAGGLRLNSNPTKRPS